MTTIMLAVLLLPTGGLLDSGVLEPFPAAVRAADAAQSRVALGQGVRETWSPMKGCTGITAYGLSMLPAQIGNS